MFDSLAHTTPFFQLLFRGVNTLKGAMSYKVKVLSKDYI
jgi:hypothetical protein